MARMPQISSSHDWLNHNIQLKYLLPLPNPPGSWQYPIPLPPPLRPPYPPYLALLVFHRPEAAPSENDDRKNPDIPVAEVAGEISHPTRENSRVATLAHSLDFHRLPSGAALLLCLSLSLARRSRSLSCCCPARCISLSRPASAQPHPTHPGLHIQRRRVCLPSSLLLAFSRLSRTRVIDHISSGLGQQHHVVCRSSSLSGGTTYRPSSLE